MSQEAPVRAGTARKVREERVEPDVAPNIDVARQSVETALAKAQPDRDKPEPTGAQRAADFAAQVKARSGSGTLKDGSPAPSRVLPVGRMNPAIAGNHFRAWDVLTEHGTAFEDTLDPHYWQHTARKLQTWDRIYVRAEDGSYYGELMVTGCSQQWAHVKALPNYPMPLQVAEPDVDSSIPPEYQVKWLGEYKKYGVIRGGQCIRDGMTTKMDCVTWIHNVLRAGRAG